jgi:hypothetical protein
MVGEPKGEGIEFSLVWEGRERKLSHPTEYPPLAGFVAALADIKRHLAGETDDAATVHEIRSLRPRLLLGHLALRKFASQERAIPRLDSESEAIQVDAPIEVPCHHVALLRRPRLVVGYRSGPQLAVDVVEYGGVFLASEEESVERAFAESEPPTHDAWIARSLSDRAQRSVVNIALRRIDEKMHEFAGVGSVASAGGGGISLGALSYALRSLVPGTDGTGPEESAGTGTSRGVPQGGRPAAPLLDVVDTSYERVDSLPAAVIGFTIKAYGRKWRAKISAVSSVKVDDGGSVENAAPLGSEIPHVLHWVTPSGRTIRARDSVIAQDGDAGRWQVAVALADDALLNVALAAEYTE